MARKAILKDWEKLPAGEDASLCGDMVRAGVCLNRNSAFGVFWANVDVNVESVQCTECGFNGVLLGENK